MPKLPWIRNRKRSAPEVPYDTPIWLGNHSNGEYFHFATPRQKRLRQLILRMADENARRVGLDRREFMASTMGMCTTLMAFNIAGCSDDGKSSKSGGDAGYAVPPDAMLDHEVACAVVGGNEFIFDVQTHHFDPEGGWIDTNRAYANFVGDTDVSRDNYTKLMFCESDTTMSALSTWPAALCSATRRAGCGLPLPNDEVVASRDAINALASRTQRVVNHCQIMPNDPGGLQNQLDIMGQILTEAGVAAWKVYPAWGPDAVGYFMDSDMGRAVIEHGLSLGVNLFCIHKGLPIPGFDMEHNQPRDIGVVAKDYPSANLVIYHSAICAGNSSCSAVPVEAEYDEANLTGSNQLIKSLLDNGIGPNENVFAELGSAYGRVDDDPVAAAHFIGKLMKYVGEDNVVWGTDAILGGRSPQGLIESFRTLTIPQSMQDDFGYVELTAERKAKIFGRNAAAIYDIDPDARLCEVETCESALLRKDLDEHHGGRRWAVQPPLGPKTWAEYVENGKRAIARGEPA